MNQNVQVKNNICTTYGQWVQWVQLSSYKPVTGIQCKFCKLVSQGVSTDSPNQNQRCKAVLFTVPLKFENNAHIFFFAFWKAEIDIDLWPFLTISMTSWKCDAKRDELLLIENVGADDLFTICLWRHEILEP